MTELLSQNDQVIEKKPNPIEELNTTMAQYYSVLHSKIYNHESNTDIHVTSDDKKIWNNKANQSDLESVKEYADSLKQSLDKVKPDIIKEVETMIDNSKDINLSDYATKVYVDAQIAALNISDDIATKTWVSNNFVNSTNYQRFDSTKYYTKDEIDNKIAGANVDNYQITEFSLANDYLNLTQNNGISTQVKLSDVSGGAITSDNLDRKLQDYLKISAIGNITFTRGGRIVTTWNPATENATVELSGGSGADSQSGGYYKPYFKNYPSDDSLPTSQLPVVGQDPVNAGWSSVNVNPEQGYFTWEIWVYIKTGGGFGDIIGPVCISGKDGDNGSDVTGKEYIYQLNNNQPTKPTTKPAWGDVPAGWTDNPTGIDSTHRTEWMMYRTQDSNGVISNWLPAKGPVIWAHWGKDGTDGDGVQYIFCALKRGETTSVFTGVNDPTSWTNDSGFQNGKAGEYIKPGSRWTDNPIDIKTATGYGQGSSQYVSIRRYRGSTGSAEDGDGRWEAYSEPSLWTYMAKDGESSSQTLKGSPLRNRGVWQAGVQYFDGTTQSDGGLFYQDFVSYTHSVVTDGASKNVTDFYVCKRQCTSIVPTNTDYWDKLSDTGPIYTDVLVAMKAYIKELTAEEVVITDDGNIVAGMTSSKTIDSGSDLDGSVTNKGDVRIWAGRISDKDLTTAPFTVTSTGKLNATDANVTGTINSKSGNIGGFTISDRSLVSENGSMIKFFNRQTTGTTLKLDINVGNELYPYKETQNLCPVLYIEDIKNGNDIFEPAGIAINSKKSNNDQTAAIFIQSGYILGFRENVSNISDSFGPVDIGGNYDYGGTFIVTSDNLSIRLNDECLKGTQFTYIMKGSCTIKFTSYKSNIYKCNSAEVSSEATFNGNSLWVRCLFDGTNWHLCD